MFTRGCLAIENGVNMLKAVNNGGCVRIICIAHIIYLVMRGALGMGNKGASPSAALDMIMLAEGLPGVKAALGASFLQHCFSRGRGPKGCSIACRLGRH